MQTAGCNRVGLFYIFSIYPFLYFSEQSFTLPQYREYAMKINDKDARVKYIRALERFLGSCVSALKNENFDFALFVKRAEKGLKTLQKVEPTRLDSTYTNALQNYVNLVSNSITHIEDRDIEETHKRLLKEANLLEKEKYRGSYKKEKHKAQGFDDGY